MTKTFLIIIALVGAMITAAGIMWWSYNNPINTALRRLHDKKLIVRCRAISELGRLGDKKTILEIAKLLQDNNEYIRESAVAVLVKLDAKESIPEITKLLQDNKKELRWWTVQALGNLGAKESIPEIKKLLKDEFNYVRQSAEETLKQLGVTDEEIQKAKGQTPESSDKNSTAPQAVSIGPESKRLEFYIEQLVLQNDEKAFIALLGVLDELGLPPEVEAYWIILNGITRLTNKDIIPKITDLILKNKDKNLGGDLLSVMKNNHSTIIIPLLSEVLEKGSYEMQMECLHQLGGIWTKESLEALFNFLSLFKDDDTKDPIKGSLIGKVIYSIKNIAGVERGNYPEPWLQWWDENKTKNADELIYPRVRRQRKHKSLGE